MGDDKRLHRQDPERTGPIRSFIETYVARPPAKEREQATESSTAPAMPVGTQPQGVDLAYQVIDKHINEGRRTAAMLNGQPYNTRGVTDRLQEVIERTIRYSSELLPLWLEALTTAVRIEPPRISPVPPATMPSGNKNGRSEGSTAVAVEMVSTRPVTVSLDMRETSERMPLAVLGLRAVDRSRPELSDIGIETDPAGGIKLRIRIPESSPPGTYSGVIVNNDTGESCGTLTVRISDI